MMALGKGVSQLTAGSFQLAALELPLVQRGDEALDVVAQ